MRGQALGRDEEAERMSLAAAGVARDTINSLQSGDARDIVFERVAQRTGRNSCWSPRSEGARGSGTFKARGALIGYERLLL